MVKDIHLEDHNVAFMADFIDYVITRILRLRTPSVEESSRCVSPSKNVKQVHNSSKVQLDHSHHASSSDVGFHFLPLSTSSESEGSALSQIMGENIGSKNENTYANADRGVFKDSYCHGFKIQSLENNCNALNLGMDHQDTKLKAELDEIEFQYQKRLQELTRKKQEAIETTKKKWMEKRK